MMAGEEQKPVDTGVSVAAPVAADQAAPAIPAASAAPVAAQAPTAAVAEAVGAAQSDAPKADEPTFRETLLEREDADRKAAKTAKAAKRADKPAEAAKPETATPEEKAAADKPKEEPKPGEKAAEAKPAEPAAVIDIDKHEFKIPETIKADPETLGKFKGILKEALANPAEAGQKLLDLHAEAATAFAAQTRRDQFKTFNDTTAAWDKKVLADVEFGGAGHATASAAVARARDALISSAPYGSAKYKSDLAEYEEFIRNTGAGSHPAMWRILHNAAAIIDEPQARDLPAHIGPVKNAGKPPRGSIYSEESRQKMNGAN